MQNADRQQVILDLIASQSVSRQGELAQMLTEKGFSVTQASVSRDLERLGVTKLNGRYVQQPRTRDGTYGPVTVTVAGENLVVVKCRSGLASAAAVLIDASAIPEVVGTIAGDDTIFVAVAGAKEQARAVKAIRAALGTNQGNEQN